MSVMRFVLFVFVSLAGASVARPTATPHCPGGVASIPVRLVQGTLIIVPVRINDHGPYDFIVDTGSQVTVVDPPLAAELDLKPLGKVGLISVTRFATAFVIMPESLETGSNIVEKPLVVVQNLAQFQAADRKVRGVLGLNFLSHFNLLLDYPRKLMCLDLREGTIEKMGGERVPLVRSARPEGELPYTERLVVAVRLIQTGPRYIFLLLDSGSDGPVLFASNKEAMKPILRRAALRGDNVTQEQSAFATLPLQDMQVGNRTLREVPFVTPVSIEPKVPALEEDGLLPTALFRRVYISFASHYVVFDPK